MARQKGLFPLQGTIGNVTFMKSKNGYLAREKGGVDAARIASDPKFQRTRENNSEFGRAGNAGKVLRDAFRILLQKTADSTLVARLTREMMKVIKMDSTSTRGQRNVLDGELELLEGFEANSGSKLSSLFYAPYTATIDRATGELKVEIPTFAPTSMISMPAGATHFRIHAGGADINFETAVIETGIATSANLPTTDQPTGAINLIINLPANSTNPIFLGLAIELLQEVNGSYFPIKNGSYNAMAFIKVSGI